ncbi:sensor histidine kinase [Sphingobacterium bambusae]|uniref:Sensor histidine kinase n=1 Tax=Sphingobacterium bambusae TaxID=662858 RepID=A0ABW6B9K5_9SPHI|nr:histidine kinase [Sphingobacterium bambusae]WPL48483.1 histidine kinase [Sphingobacterium bambusae]
MNAKLFFLKESLMIQSVGWPIYTILMLVTNANVYPERTVPEQISALLLVILAFNVCTAIFFLLFFSKRKGLAFILFTIMFFLLARFVFHSVYEWFPSYSIVLFKNPLGGADSSYYWSMLHRYLSVLLLASAMTLHIRSKWNLLGKQREERRRFEKELESKEMQLAMLNAQIDPHFVFNILNGMHDAAIERLPKLAHAIERLSGLIRYIVDTRKLGRSIMLVNYEIDAIMRYIELESLRFSPDVVHLSVIGEPCGQKVPPGVLLTFLENAFKYGYRKDPTKPITIKLILDDDKFEFYCMNFINPERIYENSSGLGLKNTRYRLDILFPDTHSLIIENNKETFTVSLKICYL